MVKLWVSTITNHITTTPLGENTMIFFSKNYII